LVLKYHYVTNCLQQNTPVGSPSGEQHRILIRGYNSPLLCSKALL